MRVLLVTPEAYPLAKTGGLGDFSAGLIKALARLGVDARILMPAYPEALAQIRETAAIQDIIALPHGGLAALWYGAMPDSGLPLWLVDVPALFDRPGGLYQDLQGRDWADNGVRFGTLSYVGSELAQGFMRHEWVPDIVHLNDWQAAMTAVFLRLSGNAAPPTLFTIHNMAFQGLFPRETLEQLELPDRLFTPTEIEYYGNVSYLKAGLLYADRLVTVSPTYAREVLAAEFGFGFDGLLRERVPDLLGILNGIDDEVWDPSRDDLIVEPYDVDSLDKKRACKSNLRYIFNLDPDDDRPVISFVSRLTHQKMADVLEDLIPLLIDRGAQVTVVGRGEPEIQSKLITLQTRYAGSLGVEVGYNEELAHRAIAGSDMLLAPARFEPCGLTQMYAMRYGTLPIVTNVGGLAETVIDASPETVRHGTATGFLAQERSLEGLSWACLRALSYYTVPGAWRSIQRTAMASDFSWTRSARQYLTLYKTLVGGIGSPPMAD